MHVNWKLILTVVLASSFLLLSLVVYSPYGDVLNILFISPIVCLTCLLVMAAAALQRRWRVCFTALWMFLAFVASSGALQAKHHLVRSSVRWLLWSERYKAEVLAQRAPANGEFRHMEWEATGFAGIANNTVYLVFDPTDSLFSASRSHTPGRYTGIPCEVVLVRRLENHWYSVLFYTDEMWGRRNALDCTGFAH